MITYNDVYNCFINLEQSDPPITANLISNGYKQKSGGYIKIALEKNICAPTQWWHIISYCMANIEQGNGNKIYRFTPCGELLFYMAEKLNAVDTDELEKLANKIINSGEIENRRRWNTEIKILCWDNIKNILDNNSK